MIYDIKTKNKSFLKVSKMLRDRKVKNNKFMLELYDETLQGVDPHARNLDAITKLKIYRECCRNFWYFVREVVLIPQDGAEVHYELNLGNLTLSYLKVKNKNFILVLPRQHGKTMGEVVFDVWSLCLVSKNTNVIYLNKGKGDAVKNLKLFKDVRDLLPDWMLTEYILDPKRDSDNQEAKILAKRNNTIKVVSPGSDPDQADKAGRGLTTSNIIFDEFAFMKYNAITFEACQPAFKRASENAKKHGTPFGITITTTPNNLDVPAGAYCKKMIDMAGRWVVECFDKTDEELDEFVQKNSENSFIYVEYSYKELGRDDEWLKEMIRQVSGNTAKIKREILLDWPRSMDTSVLTEDQLDKIYKFVKPVKSRIMAGSGNYPIDFYETPDLHLNYILSCDVAGGLSRDNSVINIIHPEDFRVVGDFRSPKIDTDSFKNLIVELMTFYFVNSLLVCERNSYGLNILQTLMKDSRIEPRMYREPRQTLGEKKQKDGFTVKSKTSTIIYGVDTNNITRKQMFDMLPELVDTEYDKFVSPNIYSDLSSLEKKRNGKIEHSASGHDDSLMAYLIFRFAVFHGRCFKDRFGINPVPSRMNVRTVSSAGDFARIEKVLETVAKATIASENTSDTYNFLIEQEKKINSNKGEQLNAFLRVTNWNREE